MDRTEDEMNFLNGSLDDILNANPKILICSHCNKKYKSEVWLLKHELKSHSKIKK